MMSIPKNKRIKSKKITDSAEGEICTLRKPGVCNHDTKTTVFAHLNGGGMGTKHHDIHGFYACSMCHDWYDGRLPDVCYQDCMTEDEQDAEALRALVETQTKLLQKGLIKVL